MRMVDIIEKKRDGLALKDEEIIFFVDGYTKGDIPDYQASALMMAIYFKGMDDREIATLTMAMSNSGDTIDLSAIDGVKVDKHSTGGVGDKTTLIVGPLVASCGVPVAKMSGRGLGHTGGTIDKLEAISGFNIELARDVFINNVNEHKLAVAGQSGNLAPADKKLYALRDVTATVNNIPLIASSIMSKKIASGADGIVLDVKTGSGAFMTEFEDSKALAEKMVKIGQSLNRQTVAVITDMNEPLGREVGNANEVMEAIEVLKGGGDERLVEVCLILSAHMLVTAGLYKDLGDAKKKLQAQLQNGKALETFKTFIETQGGDSSVVEEPNRLPQASRHIEVKSTSSGYVEALNAKDIGIAAMMLGAGRQTKDASIDYAVGIHLKKKIGDCIDKGETLAILKVNNDDYQDSYKKCLSAYNIGESPVSDRPVIYKTIT